MEITEREHKVNEAINYGLISKNVVEMVDKFSIKNNLNKSAFYDGVIDPGVKSMDSILSKMYRKTHLELNKDFSLMDVKDIIRCSVIVDNYNQVIPLIRELRKNIPSLKGDVSENETGYIGIHLSFIINGFNAEMQISTRESWYAKQAGEEIYERWRNFSLSKEVSELWTITDKEQREEKTKNIFSQYNLRSIQLSYCRNMFSSLHKYTKLDRIKEAINAVLYLNDYTHNEAKNDELRKYNIKIKDVKDKQELLNSCQNYLSLAEIAKKDLIEYANRALEIVRSNNKEKDCLNLLTQKEKDFVLLKKKYFSLISDEMKIKFNGEFKVSKYISKLSQMANKLAYNSIKCLEANLLDNLTINYDNEDFIKLQEMTRREIFSKNHFLSLININDKDN